MRSRNGGPTSATPARYGSLRQRLRRRLSPGDGLSPEDPADRIQAAILADVYLATAYGEMYGALADMVPETIAGAVVEIGAGSGIGKNWIPDLTCTDVIPASTLDAVVDACHLPYTDDSIRAFVLKDALHHIPDVTAFLDEAYRCLKPGGAVVMCEPFWGPFASLIYRTIHPEPFNKRQKDWGFSSSDAWDSNQALPWMLLRRDIDRLQTLWPNFALEERGPLLGPSYALSGGVFGRTPIPSSWLVALWRNEQRIGRILDPFRLEYAFRLVKGIDQLGIKGDS